MKARAAAGLPRINPAPMSLLPIPRGASMPLDISQVFIFTMGKLLNDLK